MCCLASGPASFFARSPPLGPLGICLSTFLSASHHALLRYLAQNPIQPLVVVTWWCPSLVVTCNLGHADSGPQLPLHHRLSYNPHLDSRVQNLPPVSDMPPPSHRGPLHRQHPSGGGSHLLPVLHMSIHIKQSPLLFYKSGFFFFFFAWFYDGGGRVFSVSAPVE